MIKMNEGLTVKESIGDEREKLKRRRLEQIWRKRKLRKEEEEENEGRWG